MAKHGREKRPAIQGRDTSYRPAVEFLEERNPPGRLSFLDFGLMDLSSWQLSAISPTNTGTSGSGSTSSSSFTATGSLLPALTFSSVTPPPPIVTQSTVSGTGTSKAPLPSPLFGGGALGGDLLQSLSSLANNSAVTSFILGGSTPPLQGGSSTGFGSFSASALAPAPGSGNLGFLVGGAYDVTPVIDSQSETEITTDPSNPFRVMQQANDNGPLGRSVQSYSDNSFRNFRQGFTFDNGDPTVTYDKFGNLWEGAIDSGLTSIDIRGSSDNGRTFFFSAVLPSPIPNTTVDDQPRIRVGASGVADAPEAIWVAMTPFTTNGSPGVFAYGLADFGFGIAPEVRTIEQVNIPGANLNAIAVGPHGEATFAAEAGNDILVSSDLDGLGPSTPQIVTRAATSNIPEAGIPIPAQAVRQINSSPRLSYDTSPGPHNGRLYLTYTDVTVGTSDTNVMVTFSDSFGGSWSAPHRLNDDLTQNSQFFSNIAVDETTGNVFAAWYDARNDMGLGGRGDTDHVPNTDVQIWGTVSRDGGLTWSKNQQISPGTSNGPSIADSGSFAGNGSNQFGDYIGIAFDEGRGWVSWTDNSNSPAGNFNRPLPDIVVRSILINRGSGFTAIGDRFKDGGGNTSSSTAAPLILNPTDTEVDGLSIFPMTSTSNVLAPDWFKFTVPTTGIMTINMDITPAWPTEGQMGIRLYQRTSSGSLVQIGVSEIPGSATPQQITVPVVAGQVLYLYCHGINGGGIAGNGTFRLRFNIA